MKTTEIGPLNARARTRVPLVTVIIPVYNRVAYIRDAIESVRKQTHPNIEVIVVDDGSTCDVVSSVRSLDAVKFYRKERGGQGSARNVGISHAHGEYMLFLDDDDLLEPFALDMLVGACIREAAVWAAGKVSYIDSDGNRLPRQHRYRFNSGDIYHQMIFDNLLGPPCTVVAKTDAIRRVGGFDEDPAMWLAEDYDLWLSMARRYQIAAVQGSVAKYRVSPGQGTRNWCRHYESLIRVLEKHRQQEGQGFSGDFTKAIAKVHFEYADSLFVAGRNTEARAHWRRWAEVHSIVERRRLCGRLVKSYLPSPVLASLRRATSAVARLLETHGSATIGPR